MTAAAIRAFVDTYLREIAADVKEQDALFTVVFPPGRKRRFGGERRFVFDAAKSSAGVEVLEPGSPLLKLMFVDAKQWGGLAAAPSPSLPEGTTVFTFQFTTFSSVKRRTKFVTATLLPQATQVTLKDGIPEDFDPEQVSDTPNAREAERLQNLLGMVMPNVEHAARAFAQEAINESLAEFDKSLGRVNEYFQGLRQQTVAEEVRIRKRLGEIQSKLYFAEDGLRQLKLEKERDRLTQDLYQLKQRRTQAEDKLSTDQSEHVERQRRRYEPKLHVRLVGVTLVQPVSKTPPPPAEPEPEAPPAPPPTPA